MSVQEDLAVPYHQQDTNYYCGAACAQMVLDSIGAGLIDQDHLYTDNQNFPTAEPGVWATSPDGLQFILNDHRPPSFASTNWFALDALTTEDAISRMLCWTIRHWKVAPVALVFGSQHWIVVRGYQASAAPTSSLDTSYSIDHFHVNNPWPPVPSWPPTPGVPIVPPPPHSGGDGCGTGGNRGVADEHISYTQWRTSYMTGVNFGHWQGRFVAVCDPEPPPTRLGTAARPRRRLQGDTLIAREQAIEIAMKSLEELRLAERDTFKYALTGMRASEPVLVQRLDRRDSFYYIVPLEKAGIAGAAAIIDARFGEYLESIALPKGAAAAFPKVESKATLDRVLNRTVELGEGLGRLVVRKEAHCLYPTLVWKPCRESLSPYYPFHMITVGGHRLYIRVDGEIFTALHDGDHGI